MENTFKLPPRLAAIAEFVPEGAKLADVGTDHGLLPIRLLLDGKIRSAVATDIRPGPLSRAEENAAAAEVHDLRCVLCDGLTGVSPEEADTVVIAGMGGENIAGILHAAPWACENALCILQPMSRSEELRAALPSLGLRVLRERLVRDAGRIYSIIVAQQGRAEALTPGEYYCGKASLLSEDILFPAFLAEQEHRMRAALHGLERSVRESDKERLAALQLAADDIARIRSDIHGNGA